MILFKPVVLYPQLFAFLITYFGSGLSISAQSSIQLSGKVTDDSGTVLPFVNIGIADTYVGTSTRVDGTFHLSIPQEQTHQPLTFSCVGFKSKQLPIESLTNQSKLIVELEQDTVDLTTMVFRENEDPIKILLRTFEKDIHSTYLTIQYYAGQVSDTAGSYLYDIEAILHHRYGSGPNGKFFGNSNCAIEKKNNLNTELVENAFFSYFMFYFNVSDDSYHCSLGDQKCLSRMNIDLDRYVPYDGRMAYKIDYEFSDTKGLSMARNKMESMMGTLYIDPEFYQVIRWELNGKFKESSRKELIRASKKGKPEHFTWTRNFREVNGNYYLSALSAVQQSITLSSNGNIKKLQQAHACLTLDVKFGKEALSRRGDCESYDINKVSYDPEFWKNLPSKSSY